jgi:hypothetical protein
VAVEIMAGRPAAKEVGMGNPAEKTTSHPTTGIRHPIPF